MRQHSRWSASRLSAVSRLRSLSSFCWSEARSSHFRCAAVAAAFERSSSSSLRRGLIPTPAFLASNLISPSIWKSGSPNSTASARIAGRRPRPTDQLRRSSRPIRRSLTQIFFLPSVGSGHEDMKDMMDKSRRRRCSRCPLFGVSAAFDLCLAARFGVLRLGGAERGFSLPVSNARSILSQ